MIKIALIGYGAIASYANEMLSKNPDIIICQAICPAGKNSDAAKVLGSEVQIINHSDDLTDDITLVVDCAGHEALASHGPAILRRGFKMITVSNGALANPDVAIALSDAARDGKTSLKLSAGAIGAMDALSAASVGGLDKVVYTGCKPSTGWLNTAAEEVIDLTNLTEATQHFHGSAREAALRYPKNANVAATIALAGIGMDETEVILIADPNTTKNTHSIEAEGAFGKFIFTIEGKPLPSNPKSSALTAMSVVKAVMDEIENIKS